MRYRITVLLLGVMFAGQVSAQNTPVTTRASLDAGTLKILDHDAYEIWNRLNTSIIASDGSSIAVEHGPENQDGQVELHRLDNDKKWTFPRGASPSFTSDGQFLVFSIKPQKQLVRDAKLAGKKKDDLPTDSLGMVDVSNGQLVAVANVKSFKLPDEGGALIAYLINDSAETADAPTDSTQQEPGNENEDDNKTTNRKDAPKGSRLILRNLQTGAESAYEYVTEYQFSKDGSQLLFVASAVEPADAGVFLVDTTTRQKRALITGDATFKKLASSDSGDRVAFLTDADSPDAAPTQWSVYLKDRSATTAQQLVSNATNGIPNSWSISDNEDLEFSESGNRLFFGTTPTAVPEDTVKTVPEDEKVVVDVWHWKDTRLQPTQTINKDRDSKRAYKAVALLGGRSTKVVQLATTSYPSVNIGDKGDAPVGLANTNVAYETETSWEYPSFNDVYTIDIETGTATRILERVQSGASLSPGGNYVTYWDRDNLTWQAYDVKSRRLVDIGKAISHPLQNELHDWPYGANPYGSGGWTANDEYFLIYDSYDIWAVNPRKPETVLSVTEGVGRAEEIRFRRVSLDPDAQFVDKNEVQLLSAFHLPSKASGFYADRIARDSPTQLLLSDNRYSTPRKAKNAETLLFTRESFRDFPDVWTASIDFASTRRVTELNPQQAEYRWGSAELTHWTSTDGVELTGLLYKPDGFDSSKQYPMMVYFYEKNSDLLHRYSIPEANRSTIVISFYVSRGYVVFVPDIVYKIGYPGESAMASVMPGVTSLIAKGFVDPARIGVQGHSWGGYQIAYMVTRTNLFKAAEAGAPVANMVSAYGGIRWGTGVSRMFQYERTQSRIGGSLWEYPSRYLENSPIFRIDAVETPLLIMHNDQDAAVPWYQGIELFVALRRLNKPAWMINYNGEPHWPTKYQNKRDWTIRMQQFFDHYLLDAPAPVWMTKGVPAVDKGKTLGLELDR